MSDKTVEIHRAQCPKCRDVRNCFERSKHHEHWDDDGGLIFGGNTYFILQCCGCDEVFFRKDSFFSEDLTYYFDPKTGKETSEYDVLSVYWPPTSRRDRPAWVEIVTYIDRDLGSLLGELYDALDSGLMVLSAIAIRTSFDRATEFMSVDPSLTFQEKLGMLYSDGRIGVTEQGILNVLVDAGSAAAHRGWSPSLEDISTLMDVLESFLHRNFVLREGADKLRGNVPSKPVRRKPPP